MKQLLGVDEDGPSVISIRIYILIFLIKSTFEFYSVIYNTEEFSGEAFNVDPALETTRYQKVVARKLIL